MDMFAPCLPRVFLHFWLPCLKVLNSSIFINLILDKLFTELSNEPSSHRTYYIASWISEILLCNSKSTSLRHPLGLCGNIQWSLKSIWTLKRIVHPKMKILLFIHPQVVSNLYEFLSSAKHKRRYFEECGIFVM